jgi:predicted RNase H-like HicB family nuclease
MKLSYTYWQEPDGWLLGCFDAYPEHMIQGKTLEELEFMLRDLYKLLELDQEEERAIMAPQRGELVLA